MAGLAQARGGGRREVYVADQQVLAELRRARDRRTGVVEHAGVPVEEQLVLAADQRAECDYRQVLAGALREHPLALGTLASVVGRSGDVEDQTRPGERLLGGRRARLPNVLADRQADALGADVQDRAAAARLEVALLIEDPVVGQVGLAVDRVHPPLGKHRRGVVDILGPLREADDRDDSPQVGR